MKEKVLIWDLPLRLFHWLLVIGIFSAWATAELGVDYRQYHFYLGYFILGLIIFRIIWGFVGPKHARFSSFIATKHRLSAYLKDGTSGAGHNPLGSLMVVAMLALVLAQAISGLFINDDILYDAPYYGVLSESMQSLMFIIHDWAFDFILVTIALHISAIIFYQKVKQDDLVKPMLTGKKHAEVVNPEDEISGSRLLLALVIAIAVAAFVYWLIEINPPPVEDYYY